MPAADEERRDGGGSEEAGSPLAVGRLSLILEEGAVRRIALGGVEALRGIAAPIRDADWRTLAVEEVEAAREDGPAARYRRRFQTVDGSFRGVLDVEAADDGAEARVEARVEITAEREAAVNRAGFVLLHPIAGVAGRAVEVRRPDGSAETARFPERIAPAQPVRDIAGLRHRVGPVRVEIAMEGEVFEMEDQRNWTDASFKTYCRPLFLPRPFTLAPGETLRQRVAVRLRAEAGEDGGAAAPGAKAPALAPGIALAHEAALCGATPEAVARLEVEGVLVRVAAEAPEVAVGPTRAPLTLEIVTGAEGPEAGIARVKAACAAAGVLPARVVALPRGYLASHQPEGPWPEGPGPMDLVVPLRAAFPEADVGGGMLTNFTEFNRRPPDPEAIDFATFGTTAIVHAADDRSVLETLEAMGDVFASARALVGGRPLRLGLLSIGMRSNPYGAAVAPNPEGRRVAMAMEDPRQRTPFGAAWAVGVAAAAARGGVASYAPAMTGGPLGMGEDGALWPIFHVVAALAALSGATVEVAGGPSSGLISIAGHGRRGVRGLFANLGPEAARVAAPEGSALLVLDDAHKAEAARDAGWIDRPGEPRAAALAPFAVAVIKEAGA